MSRGQNQLLTPGTKIKFIAFWGGPIALQRFVQINTEECNNAAELASPIQISKLPGMD